MNEIMRIGLIPEEIDFIEKTLDKNKNRIGGRKMNINLNNEEIVTLIDCMRKETIETMELLDNKDIDSENATKKIKLFNKILDELGVPKEISDNNEKACERCGITEGKKGDEGCTISVKYYKYAKQTLCDCCIDIFNGDSWGYNKLKELFGDEQAKKMLTVGFKEVPFGFKINTGLPLFLGEEENNLKNITEVANELNSELE
ncbi:hypothetical protein [Intestinibacter bartlettii]|uniref:hypothetical protein n=1 Tax=Intestinibacter bartlettii TaxID=261299 RepID=UPI003AB15DB4